MTDWSPEADLVRAEERAKVQVRSLSDLSELADARRVFDEVWPAENGSTQLQTNLMKAIVHSGGYASAAYRDGEPIGAAFAIVGRHRVGGSWHGHLHSHMAAVLPPFRDEHVGSALKRHQRAWALGQDIDTVVWTFDPLVRRNARFNLLKLGVDVDGFEADFYGNMDDGINSGDPTDRLFAWWHLDSPRVYAASMGRLHPVDVVELVASGRDAVEIELPEDIVSLRTQEPAAAREWRLAVRSALVEAFGQGYRITGVSPEDGYVLERH